MPPKRPKSGDKPPATKGGGAWETGITSTPMNDEVSLLLMHFGNIHRTILVVWQALLN